MKSLEMFVLEANLAHNSKYDYSSSNYTGANKSITITCKVHGNFNQRASAHLSGQGCKACSIEDTRYTLEAFINKAREVHNNKYDYSKITKYINNLTKVDIVCNEHGIFKQAPSSHINNGKGCPKCGKSHKPTTEEFIEKSRKVHGDKYNYSNVVYVNKSSPVNIICQEHGSFIQTPNTHLDNHGCPKCGREESNLSVVLNKQEFIEKSRKVHGDKYYYSNVVYVNTRTKTKIVCPDHGEFEQIPNAHLQGHGCHKCPVVVSKAHEEIMELLTTNNISFTINDRNIISPYEIDILSYNIGIEVHGDYWHSYNRVESTKERNRHRYKADLCDAADIKLLQIFESEWINKKDIISSMILNRFNKSNKIYARSCSIVDVDVSTYRLFMLGNHLHGYKYSKIIYGLRFGDSLVAVISFNQSKGKEFELERYATLCGVNILGGFSKLLKYFTSKNSPNMIYTFADRRFSGRSNVYTVNNFEFLYDTSPGYYYIKNTKSGMLSRKKFQKHKLPSVLDNFDKNLTESQNMFNNNYRRIWDAGHKRYKLRVV